MTWQKITFTRDQIADGEYERLHDQISDTIFRDPRKYDGVAIFMWNLAASERHDVPLTKTAFFSPDASKYFAALLLPYAPVPCERPSRSELAVMLSLGNESRLWE